MKKEDAKVEYIDISTNLRHWNTLRFAELTIFIAITGAMMNIAFGRSTPLTLIFGLVLKTAGFLIALLFWILQERTMTWWYTFVQRAAKLEEILEFEQYRGRPQGHKITGRVAIRIFFFIIMIFWIASIFI
jgi:hypothetical protein